METESKMSEQHTIIRTKEQIEELIRLLKQEQRQTRLSPESREESESWIVELRAGLQGHVLDPWSEAGYWLWNEKGTLGKDYGVD